MHAHAYIYINIHRDNIRTYFVRSLYLTSCILCSCLFSTDNRACLVTDDFRCIITGACIRNILVCDGIQHCSDNSDEENCCKLLFTTIPNEIL